MKKFVINIFLFLIPVFLVIASFIPVYFIGRETGELAPLEENILRQRGDCNILFGMGYNEQTPCYKLANLNYYEPEIFSLGTSRVMQFKEAFFDKTFYNCGGAVKGNYNEYRNFLENINYKPDVIIVGLDAWVFNDAWNKGCTAYNEFQEITPVDRSTPSLMTSIMKDWVKRKWTVGKLKLYPENIGFNGRVKDEGFMLDGSYYYGYLYRAPEEATDYGFVDTLNRIENGISRFEWGEHIDEDTVQQLESFLSYCAENDIQIIGFLAPFAPSIYKTMSESGNYGYLSEIEPVCTSLFERYGFEFYNYMDGATLNMDDDCFIDGFHGSEIVYGYMLKDMKSQGSIIESYINEEKIDTLLENAYSGLVFENPDRGENFN